MKIDYGVFGDALAAASIGTWRIEVDEGKEPRMYADATMLKLLGVAEDAELSPEEVYHAWYDHVDPAHYDAVAEGVGHMLKDETAEIQYPWHHPDGRTIVVRCGGIRDESYTAGQRVAGIHQWVTTMHHVDREFEAQQHQLKESMALANGLAREYHTVWTIDGRTHKLSLYRTTGRTTAPGTVEYGRTKPDYDSSIVWYVENFVDESDQERVSKAVSWEAVAKNTPDVGIYSVTYKRHPKPGVTDYHQMCFAKAVGDDGETNYVFAYRDVDAIVRDEMEKERKRLLGAVPVSLDVLDKANIGLWAFELDEGQPPRMYHDKTMLGLVGLDHQLPPEEAYHAWYDHVDKDCYQLVNDAVAKMMAGEHAEVQYPWHHPDGHTMIVRCGGVRNFSYTKGIRVEGTHQNVSEVLHYDEAEEKRRRELTVARAASEAKTSFLFNMSHDIRTPMNAIKGFVDIAKRNLDNPELLKDCFAKIDSSGELLLSLINSILDMSRIEAGKAKVEEAPGDVLRSFESIETTMQSLACAKSIKLSFDYGRIDDRYVYVDHERCMRVFVNLISNAIKYTNPGGIVRVSCEQVAPGRYRYTVSDNGIGMSEEYQKHLYENFSREQNSTTSGIQGTGLGLSLCKSFVELMGGTIECRSKQGEGTTFTVELPLRVRKKVAGESEQVDGRARIPAAPGLDGGPGVSALPSFSGKRVLLVEDNELNREVATYVLKEQGFEVETAEDGSVAVRIIREKGFEYYDYILMDIQMPIMGGYEATRAIRAIEESRMKNEECRRRIPIIALSANAFAEDKAASIAAGMDDHVSKPIKVNDLLTVLAKFGGEK